MMVPTAIELFSGGGGLALGLKRAGVRPLVAVELEKHAAATFRKNHPDVSVIQHDVRRVTSRLLRRKTGGQVDVLAACPPCQGFSSLTSKYKRDDHRNALIRDVGRLCVELSPKALMLENVPGLASKGAPLLDELVEALEGAGYVVNWGILQVADYGVPQRRRRLVLLAGKGFRIDLPSATHDRSARYDRPQWRTVREAISHLPPPMDLPSLRAANKTLDDINWHVIRAISPDNKTRLATAVAGKTWLHLPESMRVQCHRNGYTGYTNAYGKLSWDEPSSTITAGCTTPSKGRFGHPDEARALSVREAALLQTFPENYQFDTPHIERACEIIGNALPTLFAQVIAAQVVKTIRVVEPWLNAAEEPRDF